MAFLCRHGFLWWLLELVLPTGERASSNKGSRSEFLYGVWGFRYEVTGLAKGLKWKGIRNVGMELTENIMQTIKASGSGQQNKAESRGETYQLWKGREVFFIFFVRPVVEMDFMQRYNCPHSWIGHLWVDAAWNVTCYMELKNKHDTGFLISQLRQNGMQVEVTISFSYFLFFFFKKKKSVLFVLCVLLP